jgi:squalene-hopene/tetraprenyl-beta-curcumene cyclase
MRVNDRLTATIRRTSPDALEEAIDSGLAWLEQQQEPDGYWVGTLASNVCMEAEWLLAMRFLGIERDPKKQGLIEGILGEQRADGSWEVYHAAPAGDVNATVEAYTALRAEGLPPDSGPLEKARKWICEHGGLARTRVFTRYWLALLGEWPWRKIPNLPPEMILLPDWFPFSIYNFAPWARATLLPLSLLCSRRVQRPLPPGRRPAELHGETAEQGGYDLTRTEGLLSWERLFFGIDRCLHAYQDVGLTPGRETAIRVCLEWILRHQDADGSWGGIQPPWIYSLMALSAEGYPTTHPALHTGLDALNGSWTCRRSDGGLRIQASDSRVWDTVLSLMAMQECGVDLRGSEAMRTGTDWLIDQQVLFPGDWTVNAPGVEPGGWSFEKANLHYPDVDDTAVVLLVLARLRGVYEPSGKLEEALGRGTAWILGMQSSNGGWAAFEKNNTKTLLTKIPFCDFGEVLDPPSVDVTGHVLEALGEMGYSLGHAPVRRAVEFIRREQEPDGSWFGRWGVNYIYGTAAVLPGLRAVGEDMETDYVRRAARWVASRQNPDGGWGETCESYMNEDLKGQGESTPSQTAWALMALLEAGEPYRETLRRGVRFLLENQREGTWDEPQYTGTGFPGYQTGCKPHLKPKELARHLQQGTELSRGFMINYTMYRHYFPLIALGRTARFLASGYRS